MGDGWCFSCGGFAGHVKLMLINGTALEPEPLVTPVAMGKSTRSVELKSVVDIDEHKIAAWITQITSVPGIGGKRSSKGLTDDAMDDNQALPRRLDFR